MEAGPEPIAEVLSRLFTQRGWGRPQQQRCLEDAWRQAAGEEIAARTQVVSLKRGVLEIQVADGILVQELAGFRKRQLLTAMQMKVEAGKIKDLRFRLSDKSTR